LVVPVTLMLTTAGPLRSVIAAKFGIWPAASGAAAATVGLVAAAAALASC
jgi:hypothetical protein